MIGIYKITSPTKKVYIGQSVDIKRRFNQYYKLYCKDQTAIFLSLKKYGIENHKFEVIQECNVSELNKLERYWQEKFDSVLNGLNCKYTTTSDKKGALSEETKKKISNAQKGSLNHMFGKKTKGFNGKHTQETKDKISKIHKGRLLSIEHKKNISLAKNGVLNPMFGTVSPFARKVKCLESNKVFNSIREASEFYKIKYRTLVWYLKDKKNNKSNLIKI